MRARDTVFDSRAEREVFQELDSRLNPSLRLMAQMPLRSLFEIDDATKRKLRESQWRYYLMAAVDFHVRLSRWAAVAVDRVRWGWWRLQPRAWLHPEPIHR